jgi:hypothetical protein
MEIQKVKERDDTTEYIIVIAGLLFLAVLVFALSLRLG